MIRNIFIIKNGLALVKLHFGECHSLKQVDNLIAAFISSLDSYSKKAMGASIKNITLGNYIFYLMKDDLRSNLLYVCILDNNDSDADVQFKMEKIAELFYNEFASVIENFNGEISRFGAFKKKLLEMNLAKKNCGGRPECEGCPNSSRVPGFLNFFKKRGRIFSKE
ncbi:MAG: hypothetical protein BAJALOKI1v1_90026 [Promethearchaeota archaeon]|nr:MAG: hypothetical protein BAJALOKI1v1_90026 [Candidatus Lokiarchaeota archaeon]